MANDNKLVNLADLKEAFDSLKVNASQSAAGLMPADDKTKLDNAESYKLIGPESMVSVSDAIETKAGKVLVNITPVQSGSGDPSPTNVRPISGWTGASVTRTGFNVWDEEWEPGSINDSTGAPETNGHYIRSVNYIRILPNQEYYFYSKNNQQLVAYQYDSNGNYLGLKVVTNLGYTPISNCHHIRIRILIRDIGYTKGDICINISDPAKNGTYEPGHVVTIPISWQSEAGTVYGGTLDVTTGLLTVTMAEVDLGTLGWGVDPNRPSAFYTSGIQTLIKPSGNAVCSALKVHNTGVNGIENGEISTVPSYGIGYIFAKDTAYTDATDFKAAMSGVQLVYELATPQTYQLTPTQIALLAGENNIWADCGDITVGYLREDSLGTGEAIADAIKSSDASHGQLVKAAMTKTFNDAIEVTTPTFSTLPKTFSAVGVTPDHELVQDGIAYLSNPSAMGSDWTIATGNDEFTISGTCNDSTYIKASFCVKQKTTATA